MVGHVEELELVGSGGEGGAHDEVHLHRRQHRPQRVELGAQLPVRAGVARVEAGQEAVVRLLDRLVQEVVRGHEAAPLLVHVAAQLLQQRAEQDDAVAEGVLQLLDGLKWGDTLVAWPLSAAKLISPPAPARASWPPGCRRCRGRRSGAWPPCSCRGST